MSETPNDKVQNDIDALIARENDPERRTMMLVLQSINRSLIANTMATQKIQGEVERHRAEFAVHLKNFESHAINEEAIMNKGKGAWAILAFVLSIVQAIAIYGWKESRNEIEAMKADAHASELVHQKLNIRIEQLEKIKLPQN